MRTTPWYLRPSLAILWVVGLLLGGWVVHLVPMPALWAGTTDEQRVKAAFVYHFAQFVTWPTEKFSSSQDPFVVCFSGEHALHALVEQTLSGKRVRGRSFLFQRDISADTVAQCHILVMGSNSTGTEELLSPAARARGILTIGEHDEFIRQGGIIRLFLDGQKVRFGVNPTAAEQAQLVISSKLLRLAKIEERR